MHSHHFALTVIALLSLATLSPLARALDDKGANAVINKFLGAQKLDDAQASAGTHVIADIDGDGRQDIVLQWDVLGATWSLPKLSIFLDQGRSYRTLTTDLTGQIDKVSVVGSAIVVDAHVAGPKDPRCCPSVRQRVTYRWQNGRLTTTK
jgi:hypothetical protein